MRRLTALLAAAALSGACAQQTLPPGGPERHVPPVLLSVLPDSGTVNFHEKSVNFQFDEVISERPTGGAQRLADLVLISPRDGLPRVGWHRTRLEVRGDRPWLPNTAYTVTLRPGIVDLHGNVFRKTTVLIFSTGPNIPRTLIQGIVFDWATGKPVANALVEAFLPPDSAHYVTLADSTGHFGLGTLPGGPVTVRGVADLNNNRALDPREPWDTATVVLRDTSRIELYAFVHDTNPPRLAALDVRDSVTLHAAFDKPLDPSVPVDTTTFVLRAPDSSVVPLRRVVAQRVYERERADSIAHADSIAGKKDTAAVRRRLAKSAADIAAAHGLAVDTVPKVPLPVASRALPVTDFLIFLAQPLAAGARYTLQARAVRNLLGDTATVERVLVVPRPPPPKKAPAKAAATPGDSTGKPPRR